MGKNFMVKLISAIIAGVALSLLLTLINVLTINDETFSMYLTLNVLIVVPLFLVFGIALAFVIERYAKDEKGKLWGYGIIGAVVSAVLYLTLVKGDIQGLIYYASVGVVAALFFFMMQKLIAPMLDRIEVASALQDEAREEYAREKELKQKEKTQQK